jgi:hypothetical protein
MLVGALVTGLVLFVGILLGNKISEEAQARKIKKTVKGNMEMSVPDQAQIQVNDEAHDPRSRIRLQSNREDVVSVGLPDYNGAPIALDIELGDFEIQVQVHSIDPLTIAPGLTDGTSEEEEEGDAGERKP